MKFPKIVLLLTLVLSAVNAAAQIRHPRHSRYPNSPSNDLQLEIPTDQAQSCYVPGGPAMGYQQYQTFDTFPQPASKGYLCIALPAGGTFVIDHLFAEADYDKALSTDAEWYLDAVVGSYETATGFAAAHIGASTFNAHYVLSEPVRIPVQGGTRLTLIMHSYYVNAGSQVVETPGTASLLIMGHWE
jgi:hypothetical protein